MSTSRRIAILAAGVLVLVAAFVVLGSGDEGSGTSAGTTTTEQTAAPAATTSTPSATTEGAATPPPAAEVPTVVVKDGKPQGGVKVLSFDKGDDVRFRVTSDVADEIHVHGFDKMEDVPKGGTVSFDFPATFDGKYEVELEGAGTQIASLEIQP